MCGSCSRCRGCNGSGADRMGAVNAAPVPHSRSPVLAAMLANGDSRAARVGYERAAFGLKVEAANPRANQAESGRAIFTQQGAAIQTSSARIVRQMAPLYKAPKYRGFVGGFSVRAARAVTVMPQQGYGGVLPILEQPKVDKPWPYKGR